MRTWCPRRHVDWLQRLTCWLWLTDRSTRYDLIWCLAVLDPRFGHTMDILSPFIPVLCHSDWLFYVESCPRLDVVHRGRAWSSSPSCTWHCSLHYLFLQATPLFPHGVRYDSLLCTGWQWRNFVPYLCQLVFAAILWVKLFCCHLNTLSR